MTTANECRHFWVSNSGRGGNPVFKTGPNGSRAPQTMHVRCSLCNCRTWMDDFTWTVWTKIGRAGGEAGYADQSEGVSGK